MQPRRRSAQLVAGALAVTALAIAAAGGAADAVDRSTGAAGWQGLLGSRPAPQLGGRWVVVLEAPSLADRLRAAGGSADEARMKSWTAAARAAQEKVLARLAFRGAPIEPEHAYVRVLNGFAASLDPRTLGVIQRDPGVAGVYPVRAGYPAAVDRQVIATDVFAPGSGRRPDVGIAGFDGRGVTIALLDTGVDLDHPYLSGSLLPGIDVLDPGGIASAGQNPTQPGRPERHGTELAGLLVGSDGPAGLRGVAPGAVVRPIRVAGWQPDASGDVAVYARTDQVLAGLEAAVDPNGDGDAHDAARIALVGVVEPYAAFPDAPLARAAEGALALDTLVVAPAGNDGPAGPTYGSIGGPGGAPAALGVGAADARRRSPTAHVLLRTGLRVLASGEQPLGGAIAPQDALRALVVAVPRQRVAVVGGRGGVERLFDARGISRVAGFAALLPPGPPTPEAVRELAAAGALAVLVDGPLPAGSLGIDEAVEVPILGVPAAVARTVRRSIAGGIPVELAIGASSFDENTAGSAPAPFSAEGLAFDGGAKPELAAAGVGLATSEPGRGQDGVARYGTVSGSSVAAAVVAGAAALVAQARSDLDAAGLRGALVASARPVPGASGVAAGLVDPSGAASVELVADPPAAGIGSALAAGVTVERTITLRNVSRRHLSVRIDDVATSASGVTVTAIPATVALRPGRTKAIRVSVAVPVRPRAPSALGGLLRARIVGGATLRVPWAVAVPVVDRPLLTGMRLSAPAFVPSDVRPAVLSFVAGRVDGTAERPQLLPVDSLVIHLYRNARPLGVLAQVRHLLPGHYAFAITGRGPRGVRLRSGDYELRVVATPVSGGEPTEARMPFRVR
jgi:subtilisin family serine protease